MLTQVEVINSRSASLLLPLQDASAGYLLKDIEGLDPVKATIVSSNFANLDGSQRQSSRRESRNIVITLGLESDNVNTSVQGLRNALYTFLLPKTQVTLRFYLDDVVFAEAKGEVESFETPLFSMEPEVKVSVQCFDPDLAAIAAAVVSGSSTTAAAAVAVPYAGTIDTGVVLEIPNISHTVSSFTFYNDSIQASLGFASSVALAIGDTIRIGTEQGNKFATKTTGGITTSILYGVDPASNWWHLYPGDNSVRLLTSGAALPFTITYKAKYGGL